MTSMQRQLDSEANKTNAQQKIISNLVARLQQQHKNNMTQSKKTVTEIHAYHDAPNATGLELQ